MLSQVNKKCKRGSIRDISYEDIQRLISDLIQEDIDYSNQAGFQNHHQMIAYTIMNTCKAFSVIDDSDKFCSAFGFIPIKKENAAVVWFLSCNQFKKHMSKIDFAKDLIDMSNLALDEMNLQFHEIYCHIAKSNIFASRRAKLMGFSKKRSVGKLDEYVRIV
jgi:hypothetical protein